jgi:hypothetical protein
MRRVLGFGVCLALGASPLAAQGSTAKSARKVSCAIDSTAEWATLQRTFLNDAKHDWSDDALRTLLLRSAGVDASKPLPLQAGFTRLDEWTTPADSLGASVLRSLAAQRGSTWPTQSVVGAAGVHAVWLLAMSDSTLEPIVLKRQMEAGLGESFEPEVAMLEDRIRARTGRGQLYGSALRSRGGSALAPTRIEDSSHVDLRRDGAWLPPLTQSLCAAGQAKR